MRKGWLNHGPQLILLCITAGMVILNILLVRQNWRLRSSLSVLSMQLGDALDLTRGSLLPSLQGYDPQGDGITVDYQHDERDTLLLVFATTCGACDENWATWQELVSKIDQEKVRVVGANLDGALTKEYFQKHGRMEFLVLAEVEQDSREAYRLQRTPQTILIDEKGEVAGVWTGILREQQISELNELLRQTDRDGSAGMPLKEKRDSSRAQLALHPLP